MDSKQARPCLTDDSLAALHFIDYACSGAGGFGSTGVSEAVSENGNKRLKQEGEAMEGALRLEVIGCICTTRSDPTRQITGPSHNNHHDD